MSTKRLQHGVAAWLAVLTVIFALDSGSLFGANFGRQESGSAQEKKDDKKDEKKEEKKLSLKSARKIEFTTDEGTWISLDVSPDGKTIAFELLGDIYSMPITGGEAMLVDGGMAFDSQPKFSPDGKWIAFLSDRDGNENVWMMHADGSDAKQLSKDPTAEFASPSWSPDGKLRLCVQSRLRHQYV
jgi:Tol biopolymer transport system component